MTKIITLAGGCFWGTEKFLQCIEGVVSTQTGYANGLKPKPTYQDVCAGSGHAEAVRVEYDPSRIRLEYLLSVFYKAIDPTVRNRQGNDIGVQYRTGIYYETPEDKAVIESSLKVLQAEHQKPIEVECLPLLQYNSAEEYHQKYLDKNPGGYCHIGAHEFLIAQNAKDSKLL